MEPDRVNGSETPPRLVRRDPRPLIVHALVDAAIVFLLIVIVLLVLDVDIVVVVVVAAVAGSLAAPLTRRAEERALAARPEPDQIRGT
jgi:hypothetical protein